MPNHVMNTLNVTGPQQDIEAFKEFARQDKELLDLNKFVPMPDEIKTSESSNQNTWSTTHWETKWGTYNTERSEPDDTTLDYYFNTAQSPFGDQVMETMSKRFPTLLLKLSYEEPGMAFAGHCTAQNEEIIESESHEMTLEELDLDLDREEETQASAKAEKEPDTEA